MPSKLEKIEKYFKTKKEENEHMIRTFSNELDNCPMGSPSHKYYTAQKYTHFKYADILAETESGILRILKGGQR